MTASAPELADKIRGYWSANPCGRNIVGLPEEDPAFFERHDRLLRELYPYVDGFLGWVGGQGGRLLEVGCGLGYAAAQVAASGRTVVATDLTWEAARLTTLRLRHHGLKGHAVVADGAALPFRPGAFQAVMSLGVIHHTHDPKAVVGEIHRVAAPGARALFMLYHRVSIHMLWILGFLWPVMLFLHLAPAPLRRAAMRLRPGLKDYWLQERMPTPQDAVNAGTDSYGLRNPVSRIYSKAEARRLLAPFRAEGFLCEDHYGPGRWTAWRRRLNAHWGFFLYARCRA